MKTVLLLFLLFVSGLNGQLIANIGTVIASLISVFTVNPGILDLNLLNILNITQFIDNLPAVLTALCNGQTPEWLVQNTINHLELVRPIKVRPSYDFIVVGAGSAGSIVASRLSENPNISVLLINYGGAESLLTDIPLLFPIVAALPAYDWGFLTVPQNNSHLNIDGQRGRWHRGKAMGGSSTINAMMYVRGNRKDFDNWATVTGDDSWSYANLLPYFMRSEHNYDPAFVADGYHGVDGPFPVNSQWESDANPSELNIIRAAKEFGANQIDFNGATQIGGNCAQQNILNGSRISASKAFLEPVYGSRPNLDILSRNLVTRVLFNGKTAIGVEYKSNPLDVSHTVLTNKEVILSAGAIKTPHILLQSGVGPAAQLNALGIQVVADLSGVGENLHDHVNTMGIGYSVPSIGTMPLSIGSLLQYATVRSGPLSELYDYQGYGGNFSSSYNPDPDWPDVQVNALGLAVGTEPTGLLINRLYGLKYGVFAKMYASHFNQPSFQIYAVLMRPQSVGRLWINSTDPFVYPNIDPRYFSDPANHDINVLVEAGRWLFCFQHTREFRAWKAVPFKELVVGCESLWGQINHPRCPLGPTPPDAYLACHARRMTTTIWHFCGTAKMGAVDDPTAVVDTRLRVLGGISGLRVIDASVMPNITNGNIYAPTMAIGEKGAQMIRHYYRI